jgi:catechol 2,3-dioxygenase-like lactoylglutathione lyase family enzyme
MIERNVPSRPCSNAILRLTTILAIFGTAACSDGEDATVTAVRPPDIPALHHVGLNTTNLETAIAWYLDVWPTAERTEISGKPAVAGEMYLVFNEVGAPPAGAFEPALGRPAEQSAFWHIGAFANTTDMDTELAAVGVEHLPLYTSPDDSAGVWRSGLTPYSGIVGAEEAIAATRAPPRPGGFSYALAPDGVLFEFTGGATTTPSLSHVHLFHEQPRCAANWYVANLGMALPPIRNDDDTSSPRPPYEPCEADPGTPGWPSLERAGTIREPRGSVTHGNGRISWYPEQCTSARCDDERGLVPSRGQALDHVSFSVVDADAWHSWLHSRGVTMVEELHDFDGGRAFMFEGPDRLAIELVAGTEH